MLGVAFGCFAIYLAVRWNHLKTVVEAWLTRIEKGSILEAVGGYWAAYVMTLLLMLPVEMVNFFGGFLFAHDPTEISAVAGVLLAVVVSYSALVVAGLVYFLLSRFVFQSFVHEFGQQFDIFNAVLRAIEKDGVWFVLLLRLSPFSPFSISNIVLGVSSEPRISSPQRLPFGSGCCQALGAFL